MTDLVTVASAIIASSNATPDTLRWQLKDPVAHGASIQISLNPGELSSTEEDRQSVIPIMGRPDPVVMSDIIGLPAYQFTMVFLTEAAYQAFEQIRAPQHVLLLQGPHPWGQAYVRLGESKDDKLNLPSLRKRDTNGDVVRTVTLTLQAVAAP